MSKLSLQEIAEIHKEDLKSIFDLPINMSVSQIGAVQYAVSMAEKIANGEYVPIIRCKNCNQGWHNGGYSKNNVWIPTIHCDRHNCNMKFDDFCSYAERRDDIK